MAKEYLFWGVITLDDASEHRLDLEEHGWAEKTRLARTVRFALIPKDDAPDYFRPVVVNIPTGAKPVFKTRVKVANPIGDTTGRVSATIRIYGIGYKQGGHEPLFWILPNGAIEFGEDSPLADLMLRQATFI